MFHSDLGWEIQLDIFKGPTAGTEFRRMCCVSKSKTMQLVQSCCMHSSICACIFVRALYLFWLNVQQKLPNNLSPHLEAAQTCSPTSGWFEIQYISCKIKNVGIIL